MSAFKFRFRKKPPDGGEPEQPKIIPGSAPAPPQPKKSENPAKSWWPFNKKPKKEPSVEIKPGEVKVFPGREPVSPKPVPPKPVPPDAGVAPSIISGQVSGREPIPPKPIPPKPIPPKPVLQEPTVPPKSVPLKAVPPEPIPPKPEPPKSAQESRLKELEQDAKKAAGVEKSKLIMPEVFAGKKPSTRKLLPKLILLLLVVFLVALVVTLGPKYKPELIDKIAKIDKIGIMEKLGLKKPEPEKLITPEEEAVEELVTVRTYRVARGDFIDVLPGMGTIKGEREIELRFPVNGVVDSINFFEGDLVRKGDIAATLDQKDALLKLEYAKSKLKTQEVAEMSAKKKLEIHQQLYDKDIIIRPKLEEVRLEYESAKTQVTSAQKEVEFALAELDKTYLYSPLDGVLGTRDVEVGEFVNSNIKVAAVYDASTVIAELGVIEKDIVRVALGQKAKVNVDAYPGVDFEGKIDNVSPIIEGKARTLTVKIRIENDNPRGTLLPGMFARIWVSVYEKKDTIKVPSACLYDLDNDGEFESVYVVSEDNIAQARAAKIGYVSTDYIEITDGLDEGEQVICETMAELKDGVKVEVIEVQEAMF